MRQIQIDHADKLPPERVVEGRTPPWTKPEPRTDWRVTLARGVMGLVAALLIYLLAGREIRTVIVRAPKLVSIVPV